MSALSLTRPVENLRSAEEEQVIALIDHLAPILSDWRRAEDLRNQLPQIERDMAKHKQTLKDAIEQVRGAKAHRDLAFSQPASYGKTLYVALAIGLLLMIFLSTFGAIVGVLVWIGGAVMAYSAAKAERDRRTAALNKLEAEVALAHQSINSAMTLKSSVEQEVAARSGGFPEVRIASLRFGLEMAYVDGRNVLLDVSGCQPQTVLRAVDVSALQQGLSLISAKAEALLSVPPMLVPGRGSQTTDPVNQLFGEEDELQELVGEFTLSLGKLRDIHIGLPLVEASNVLVRRLTGESPTKAGVQKAGDGPAITFAGGGVSHERIQEFVREANRTRQHGQHVLAELKEVFENLESACMLYATARTTSINTVHENLTEVLNRAAWCNRRFYCPRTILSPKYLGDLLMVDPAEAYRLSLDDLVTRLKSDKEIAKRLSEKSDLMDQLTDAYHSVQNFMGDVTVDQNGAAVNEYGRPRHMEEQFRESAKLFGSVLTKVMTGSAYPILNFSAEAQVFFDPEFDEWRSEVVPYTYTTPDILKYGGVVKAYSDLMLPLWEHLWSEKADFRKSELFRTNESMIRMSEKESEKLIDIGNQFKADMRAVRENVHLLESELASKHNEILSFRDGMDQLNLLSARVKAAVSDEKLASMVVGEPVIPRMSKFELVLATLPQAQAESRGVARDPIEMVREPDALVGYQGNVGVRLLAA